MSFSDLEILRARLSDKNRSSTQKYTMWLNHSDWERSTYKTATMIRRLGPLLAYSALALLLFLGACQPTENLIIVPDNTAPPDLSIPVVIKENYVNKLYISLLGRKPTEPELFYTISLLDENNASVENREAVIEEILKQPEYLRRTFEIANNKFLPGLDTFEITQRLIVFNTFLDSPAFEPFYGLINYEIDRLAKLKTAPVDFQSGAISRIELHRRLINNSFYDDINMGSQNFVLAVFEALLNRYPTDAELTNSVIMVDGFTAIVLGVEGDTKDDFLNIFFDSDDYYEGQVNAIYRDFLFREPNSQEMGLNTVAYRQDNDYGNLLKRILTTDEYLGL